MTIVIERVTNNPSHKVLLGLLPEDEREQITLAACDFDRLDDNAQKRLANLSVDRANKDGVIAMCRYEPKFAIATVSGLPYITRYVPCDLDACFSHPNQLTIDLVLQWIEHLTVRCDMALTEVNAWHKTIESRQEALLECFDDDKCYYGLKELSGNCRGYASGPYGIAWSLASEAIARITRIDRSREAARQQREKEVQSQAREARVAFVSDIVLALGNDNQKERFMYELLPMTEVIELIHKHVLGSLYDREIKHEFVVNKEKPRLTANQYTIYKMFKNSIENADLTILNDITIEIDLAQYTDQSNQTKVACRVTIGDNFDHSNWESEVFYSID